MSEIVSFFELCGANGDGRSYKTIGRVKSKNIADAWVAENANYRDYQYVSFYVYNDFDALIRSIEGEKVKQILSKLTPEESTYIRNFYSNK